MREVNRRQFMKYSAGTLMAGVAAPAWAQAAGGATSLAELTATTPRTLGACGVQGTLLGMGTGVRSWNGRSALTDKGRPAFLDLLEHAYQKGVRFFDMADMYGSHDYVREAVATGRIDRDRCLFLSKAVSREASLLQADLERFRRELDTDRLDVVLLHCLTKPGWTQELAACMDVMVEAKAKGQIRAHGVSCHNLDCMREAAESPWVDVILARINPFGVKMDGTPEEVAAVLKKAQENGKGVLGMKILGEGPEAARMEESLRFVLGLGCVDAMTIGFLEPKELDGVFETIARIA